MRLQAMKMLLQLLLVTGAFSCEGISKKEKYLARVGSKYLLYSDLQQYLEENKGQDSTELIRNYTDNWIRQQVLIQKAENNLTRDQKNKDKQVEDYRNALIIYEYQKLLLSQLLDTSISAKEVEDYYAQNRQNFELKENIVRLRYVKFQGTPPGFDDFIRQFRDFDEKNREKVLSFTARHALNSYYNETEWLAFNDVIKEVPISTYDQESWLRQNRFLHISRDNYHYLVYISEFRIKNDISPLSFEREKIRNILLNQRRQKLIFDMEKKTLEDAYKNGEVEIIK
jgi:hypothetical protein